MPREELVALPEGPRLAVRRAGGSLRPYLLVHGLASNARLWDGVARHLEAAGHEVVAVDQRGHGLSDAPVDGYSTATCAADLAALCQALGLVGGRAPIAVGQSWGADVVTHLAARHGGVAGLGLVDGGWFLLRERFQTFEACWDVLAPPRFDGVTRDDIVRRVRAMHPDWPDEGIDAVLANFAEATDGTVRSRLRRRHHRQILESMYAGDPRRLLPSVTVPVLLVAAGSADRADGFGPNQAADLLPDAVLRWYPGADHDVHAQHPESVAADLLGLAARVDEAEVAP